MKAGTIILVLLAIGAIWMFLIPPATRCKFMFWRQNACSELQSLTQFSNQLGYDIDPNKPVILEPGYGQALEDVIESIRKPANTS